MMYRDPETVAPPALVVYPQRASTAVVFAVVGAVSLAILLVTAVATVVREGVSGTLLGFLFASLFLSIFLVTGLRSWLLRVDLTLPDDGTLALRWTEWPSGTRTASVRLTDVVDVVLEHGDETARIVITTRGEPIPLTRSLTSDDLTGKVDAIKAFLGRRGG